MYDLKKLLEQLFLNELGGAGMQPKQTEGDILIRTMERRCII